MALTITADEVRNRLITYTSYDVTDAMLASAGLIPLATAYINTLLVANSTTYDDLSTSDKKAIAKGMAILYCAMQVVNSAPLEEWQEGPIKSKSASNKDKIVADMKKDFTDLATILGLSFYNIGTVCRGGDDYVPDYDDQTNIDYSDTEDSFSRFS
ncbi:hypothetical protein H8E88_05130 [candidate division KSB1 bacterium]|nr:hypothetical protein [candidate division KSB1 bacterium]